MGTVPPRLAKALQGRYRIERELGSGGMATVYLADDTRHERKVALKVLKPELAAIVGGERFLAEIKTTANLQHPHILPLFDSGESDGFLYYVMPYVEGESLRDRLDRERQLPVDEAARIATRVAEALDYAHERGVIHRDIKPANIMLQGGEPVISDFGIALAVGSGGGSRLTETGLSLGTPHYMSPEQATGDAHLGPGTDIWALGCILYEMLTGEPPYVGATGQAVLGRILTSEAPSAAGQRKTVPPHLDGVVARALEKLPADRFASAGGFAAAVSDPAFRYRPGGDPTAEAAPPADGATSGRLGLRTVHTAATVGLAIVAATLWLTRGSAEAVGPLPTPVAVVVDSGAVGTVAVASDGTIGWLREGTLKLRPPGSVEPRTIQGMGDGIQDFSWSPDARRVAVRSDDGIVTVSLQTGLQTTILGGEAAPPLVLTNRLRWADDGWIYYSVQGGQGGRVFRLPDTGGTPEEVATVPRSSGVPVFSLTDYIPGGGGLLLTVSAEGAEGLHPQVVHLDLDGGDLTILADSAASGVWAATGHVVYARVDGSVWALPWNEVAGRVAGPAMRVGEGAERVSFLLGPPRISLGPGGALAYLRGRPLADEPVTTIGGAIYLELLASDGSVTPLEMPYTDHPDAAASRDGRFIAYTRDGDIRVFDRELGTEDVLATDPNGDLHDPVWSPDGREVAYWTEANRIAIRASDGSGTPRVLPAPEDTTFLFPTQWLDDGTLLLYRDEEGQDNVFVMPADGSASPRALLSGGLDEFYPTVSPDGEWIAYFGGRSDGPHLFVRRWPELDGEIRLDPDGAPLWPAFRLAWTPDSRGLVVVVLDVPLAGGRGAGPAFSVIPFDPLPNGEAARPRSILPTPSGGRIRGVLPDGRILVATEQVSLSRISAAMTQTAVDDERLVVVANWFTFLREREAAGGSTP